MEFLIENCSRKEEKGLNPSEVDTSCYWSFQLSFPYKSQDPFFTSSFLCQADFLVDVSQCFALLCNQIVSHYLICIRHLKRAL